MKSFSMEELRKILPLFQKRTGAQVQNVVSSSTDLSITLYQNKKYYLHFSMIATAPLVLLHEEKAPKILKKTTPTQLFIKKYLVDYVFHDVSLLDGRILKFIFTKSGEENVELEVRLFPHGQNIIVTVGNKKIAWAKPKEVKPSDYKEGEIPESGEKILSEKLVDWWSKKGNAKEKASKSKTKPQDLIKKLEAQKNDTSVLEEYQKEIAFVAEQKDVERIKKKYKIDPNIEWYEVLNILKEKVRKLEGKSERISERLQDLKRQEERGASSTALKASPLKASKYKLLNDGKRALLGKNAKENVQLMRSAKPWYLWLHLRDMPSAHIIIEKNKNQEVSDKEIIEVANWLLDASYKGSLQPGDKFEVQFTECRYVKPIKGDRLGRVTVQKERVLGFTYKSH